MEPFRVRPRHTLRRADSGSGGQPIKKALSRLAECPSGEPRATIRPMSQPDALRRKPLAVVGLVVVLALLAAACGPSNPSTVPTASAAATAATSAPTTATSSASGAAPAPSASADAASIYDTVERQVIAIRGLQPTHPVDRQIISEAELRTMITQQFDEDTPPAYLAATERLYKALDLIPASSSLRTLSLDLLSGGVVGFYRNDQGKLYVVSKTGIPGANERFYFAHEFDHALQDQNSTIFKDFNKVLDQSDQLLARQSIYEGDATLLMTKWATDNLSQAELLELLSASSDPNAQAVMTRTPAILRDTLTFPYTNGLAYVSAVQSSGGWAAVNAYFKAMPKSSEQILHPEKYTGGEMPVPVTFPADLATRLGTGWTVPLQDTFGEFQLGIWLRENGVVPVDATKAVAGWGGDRLAVMEGPRGAWAIAIHTEWDANADATEFEAAAAIALKKAGGVARLLPGVGGKTRWVLVAGDAATLGRIANVLGLAG